MRSEIAARLRQCSLLGAIVALHILVFWQVSFGDRDHRSREPREAPAMLSWFVSPEPDVSQPAPRTPPTRVAPTFEDIPKEVQPSAAAITAPLESDRADAPIDWSAEASRAASDAVKHEQDEKKLRQFGQIPRGIGPPPPKSPRHQRGDSQHFEGGEIVTWINDHCYYTNQDAPIAAFGPALRLQHPVCKGTSGPPLPTIEEWKKERDER